MATNNPSIEFKLDLKDRKILYELDSDARQPCSKIAKRVGLSTEVVNYRIKRLEEEGIITQYQCVLNLSKLGIRQFKICLSFQHLSPIRLEEIIGKLKKISYAKWIVSCKSNWDLIISLETKSIEEIDSIKNAILSLFEGYINKKAISICTEASTFNRNYLLENKNYLERERILVNSDKEIKLEEIDLEILKKLSENARKPLIDIASELKKSPRIIDYRMKQMIKYKIVTGFRIALNYKKLNLQFYKTFIYLDNPKQERVNKLIKYFQAHKNIIHHVRVIGNWDLEPEFEVYSEAEFDKIINDLKQEFSDIIKNIEIITISKEHKFVYF